MLINQINLLSTLFSVDPKSLLNMLQVGQTLDATVIGRNNNGLLELQIGKQKLTADIHSHKQPIRQDTFQPGQKLKLVVLENKENLVLQVLDKQQNNQTKKPLLQQLLRQSLPYYNTSTKLFTKLRPAISQNPVLSSSLPKPVIKQIRELIATLPNVNSVTNNSGLKQAIDISGLFLEARLSAELNKQEQNKSSSPEILKKDFKAGLLRLSQVIVQNLTAKERPIMEIKPRIPGNKDTTINTKQIITVQDFEILELNELKRLVDSAIARIQVNQANSILTNDSQPPVWLLDIPINDEQETALAELQISYEKPEKEEETNGGKWHVAISIELNVLGKVHARISLLNHKVSLSIWAESDFTYHLIEQYKEQLSNRLTDAGLDIDCINCYPGKVQTIEHQTPSSKQLFSVRI